MGKISCIVPAFNESKRIIPILDMLSHHPLVSEIIVVDDGSSDSTADVVKRYKNIQLISHHTNKGKTTAIHSGIMIAQYEYLLLLDADLEGLTEENVTNLIMPVLENKVEVTISMRKNSPWIDKVVGIDYISGERVFRKSLLDGYLDSLIELPKFGFEVFLNKILIRKKSSLAVIYWENVVSPYKSKKYGFITGLKADIFMVQDILKIISVREVAAQFTTMIKLKKKI